jgi:hypothetical protein
MAGAIGERDRDRGPRGDAGAATSLWIDYVLLPEKLEEHLVALAAGQVASPTPADLITMFLEQALLNHKGSPGSSSALLSKDGVSCLTVTSLPKAMQECNICKDTMLCARWTVLLCTIFFLNCAKPWNGATCS